MTISFARDFTGKVVYYLSMSERYKPTYIQQELCNIAESYDPDWSYTVPMMYRTRRSAFHRLRAEDAVKTDARACPDAWEMPPGVVVPGMRPLPQDIEDWRLSKTPLLEEIGAFGFVRKKPLETPEKVKRLDVRRRERQEREKLRKAGNIYEYIDLTTNYGRNS